MKHKHLFIKFVKYNGKRHYFIYEDKLDTFAVHEGTFTFEDEQTMYYRLIYKLVEKYGYGTVSNIAPYDKKNTNTIIYDMWVK